jgi:thiol-disulfide isomerase/thioredoxin
MRRILQTAMTIVCMLVINIVNTYAFAESGDDGLRFKEEYEALNGLETPYGSVYATLDIPEDNPFIYTDIEEIKGLLADGTGVIYFGFPECPWCRAILPVFIDAIEDVKESVAVYVYNLKELRNELQLADDGTIVTKKEGTEEYDYLVNALYDWLGAYNGLNDDSIRRIYMPTLVFVRNGRIMDVHVATVSSQSDPYTPLDQTQYQELYGIIRENLLEITED